MTTGDDGLGQAFDVRRAAAGVDIAAVGLDRGRRNPRSQALEDRRRGPVGGAVRAIEQDVEGREVEVTEPFLQGAQVVVEGAVQRPHAPEALGPGRLALQVRLDLRLHRVGQLVAVGAEELDPVVDVGVVGGRQDHAEVKAITLDQHRRSRGGQDTAEQDVAAAGRDPRGDARLEHLARLAGVADDEHLGTLGVDPLRRGTSQCQGQLCGHDLAGRAADPVRAEQVSSLGEIGPASRPLPASALRSW